MPNTIQILKQALHVLENRCDPSHEVIQNLRSVIDETQKPYGWKVTGVSQVFTGDFAYEDAVSEARQCGPSAKVFPLYTLPVDVTESNPECKSVQKRLTTQIHESIKDAFIEGFCSGADWYSSNISVEEAWSNYQTLHNLPKV